MNIIQRLHLAVNSISPIPFLQPFKMTQKEKELFNRIISQSKHYLEFGMGGSTFHVLKHYRTHVHAIDSSLSWIEIMRQYLFIRNKEKAGQISIYHVDIGKTGNWGRPVGFESRELFPKYSSWIFDHIPENLIDTVLVDGRFRVACMLQALMKYHQNPVMKYMMHDFERKDYQVVLAFMDIVEQADGLVLLKPKSDLDLIEVKKKYEQYKYNDD